MKKKKTAVRKGNCNPVWNEALSFSLSSANLQNAAIEVSNELLTKIALVCEAQVSKRAVYQMTHVALVICQ